MSANFHQLHIFHTVARLRSFSRAAEELGISQPAVSIQVRELEKAMGCALVHRMRRGLQLTDAGETVFSYTRRIFALAEEMESAVQEIRGLRSGRLTIGSSTTPGEYILPWVIGQFRRRYPGIEVSLSISNTQSVVDSIQRRELDMGMAGAPVSMQGLVSFPYVSDEIVVIAAPGHPLAARNSPSLKELEGQDFILREPGSATRGTAESCLKDCGVSIRVVMELGSNEAVKRAVAAGLGLGMVSKFSVTPDVKASLIKVLPVSGWRCQRPLTVFYRDDKHLPAAQQAFISFLQKERPLPETPG
jgi:DNA-binding transcriptional LysR family regulator